MYFMSICCVEFRDNYLRFSVEYAETSTTFTVSLVLPEVRCMLIFLNEIPCLSIGVFVRSSCFSVLFTFIFCYRSVRILEEFVDIIVSDWF
jgi:hypothetical protein